MTIFDRICLFWFCSKVMLHSFSLVLVPHFCCTRKKFRDLESTILSISDANNSRFWPCRTEAHRKTISFRQEQFYLKSSDFGRTWRKLALSSFSSNSLQISSMIAVHDDTAHHHIMIKELCISHFCFKSKPLSNMSFVPAHFWVFFLQWIIILQSLQLRIIIHCT